MCKVEGDDDKFGYREDCEKGFMFLSQVKVGKSRSLMVLRPRVKLFAIRAITVILLCACVTQLMTLGEIWGPRLFKGWPSCLSPPELPLPKELPSTPNKVASPPKSEFWAVSIVSVAFFTFTIWSRRNPSVFLG